MESVEDVTKNTLSKLWLYQPCHEAGLCNDAFVYHGTAHIIKHIKRVHNIDPVTGEGLSAASAAISNNPFMLAAGGAAGSARSVTHHPYEETELQAAIIDWVMIRDLSFSDPTASSTRGVLSWGRSALLHALPNSKSTLSNHVNKRLANRKLELTALVAVYNLWTE